MLFNVFDAFVSLGGPNINAVEIVKGIGKSRCSIKAKLLKNLTATDVLLE